MAKLSRNSFIEKHKQGTLVGFDFADFRIRKRAATTSKRPPKTPQNPQYRLLRLHEKSTGKIFPTPNQIVTALAKRFLKSDYFIESDVAGTVQGLFIADGVEAKALADKFPHRPFKPGNGRPAKLVTSIIIDTVRAETLARGLKLL